MILMTVKMDIRKLHVLALLFEIVNYQKLLDK